MLAFIATLTLASVASATTIYIPTVFGPGGLGDKNNEAFKSRLEKAGYTVEIVRTGNCVAAQKWINDNKDKAMAVDYLMTLNGLQYQQPDHPGVCNFPMNKENILVINRSTYMNVCTKADPDATMAKIKAGKAKVAIAANPPAGRKLIQDMFDDIAAGNELIAYKNAAEQRQALASGEVDVQANLNGGTKAQNASGAKCLVTTAPSAKAKELGMISVQDLNPKAKSVGVGVVSIIWGMNVDAGVRKAAIETVNTDPLHAGLFADGAQKVGMAAGSTEEEQWRIVEDHMNLYKK